MSVEKGSAFLLKIGDGGSPLAYTTIAGLRPTQLSVSGEAVNITNKDSGGWRELLSGAGVRAVSVSAAGLFTGPTGGGEIPNRPPAGGIHAYEKSLERGGGMQGRVLVTRLEYAGDYNGERTYTISLESSGVVVSL